MSSAASDPPQPRTYGYLLPAAALVAVVFFGAMLELFTFSFQHFERGRTVPVFTLGTYARFFSDRFYLNVLATTLRLAGISTLIGLLVAYPTAYALSRLRRPGVLIPAYILLFSPMLVSAVVIAYGWLLLLSDQGLWSFLLRTLRITDEPRRLIFTFNGVVIAMVHALMPLMVFPLLSVIRQVRPDLKEAAHDLGADRWQTFRHVTFPLTMPGVLAAGQIAFTLSVSAFAVPTLIGGGRVGVLSRQIYADLTGLDLPMAAVGSLVMLVTALLVLFLSNLLTRRYFERSA